jgi:hypothetical protein
MIYALISNIFRHNTYIKYHTYVFEKIGASRQRLPNTNCRSFSDQVVWVRHIVLAVVRPLFHFLFT